jgi:dTDP-4-dehydrorhamnose 3,5-epimerase
MIELVPLEIMGAFGVKTDLFKDTRGGFTRVWESNPQIEGFSIQEISYAFNPEVNTLRGIHFQSGEFAENKYIFCVSGVAFDVCLDLRKNSNFYLQSISVVIGPTCDYQGVYLPAGTAHGYLTLEIDTNLIYLMDKPYNANASSGLKWDDESFQIPWPHTPKLISGRDNSWQRFDF